MKRMRIDREGTHFSRRDHHAGLVPPLVQFGLYAKARGCMRVADQFHERFEGQEGAPPPILREVTEEPMLDSVPLACAGRKVRHVNRELKLVGQTLESGLPRPRPIAIAATG